MNKKQLNQEILNYCREHGILGSINQVHNNYLISFEIKKKKPHCKECGKEI